MNKKKNIHFLFILLTLDLLLSLLVEAKDVKVENIFSNRDSGISSLYPEDVIEEAAIIKSLTMRRKKRNLLSSDYHILELQLVKSNRSFHIHISKLKNLVAHKLRVIVQNENTVSKMSEDQNYNECLFSGSLVSVDDTFDEKNQIRGTAALSLCELNNGNPKGFSGLIIAEEHYFVIHPSSHNFRKISTEDIIPHTIIVPSEMQLRQRKVDVVRVPKEDLDEALSHLGSENAIYDEDDYYDEYNDTQTVLNAKAYNITETLQNSSSDGKTKVRLAEKKSGGKKKKKFSPKSISKKKIVEIAVFTDPALYQKHKMKTPNQTVKRIKNEVLASVNNMNLLYQQSSLGVDLSFRLVHLEIMKGLPKKLDTHKGLATKYLKSFCRYAGDKNKDGQMWDHALMLTGLDLKEDGDSSTAGLAWAGTMCLQYWSCSVSEGYSFGSVFTIAHEIGHSLGMEHDGFGPSKSCDEEKYLMSPTTGPGKVTWSTCSSSNIKEFIATGNPEKGKKDLNSRPKCLNVNSPLVKKSVKFESSLLPGQKYNATYQCSLECGAGCTPYQKAYYPYNNICAMLYCKKAVKTKEVYRVEAHPALEGTKCLEGKNCRAGKCVAVKS